MMALTMAGWFAQGFIQSLVDKAVEIASSRFAQYQRIGDTIDSLQNSLLNVQSVLEVAERRQTKVAANLELLMKKLKLVAYEAEDLLDEINYDILKHKIEHGDGEQQYQPAGNFSLSYVANVVSNNIGNQAADIQRRLDELDARIISIIQLLPKVNKKKRKHDIAPTRETSSCSYETKLFGRQDEFEQLVNLLTGRSRSRSYDFFITIYGMGGIGKTTLVQFVYNDERVKDYFDLKAWVCVSDCFDERRITKEIVESIAKGTQSDINLNILQLALREKITSKKVLIVLDDVWNEDSNRWEKLCAPLVYASPDSKILLTSRSKLVASKVGSRNIIHLTGLEGDDFWQLFEKYAFRTFGFEQNQNLIPLGRKIVTKLRGSPLAAKTVGSVLRLDSSEEHWRAIMESKLCELPQADTDILPALQLSYEYLPPHLKQCFSYCSLYPRDCRIEKDELVYIWMSQGLILRQSNMRIEDVGISYINTLTSRCLFEKVLYNDDCIKMHDLIHELAEFVSNGENLRMDICLTSLSRSITNLSINPDNFESSSVIDTCNKNDNLRTLMILNGDRWHIHSVHLDYMLASLRSLRMLTLVACHIRELQNNIGNLKHLRYCDISLNNIESLPEAICSLYNLQYLNILWLPLKTSPIGMCNLINLRCLKANKDFIHKIDNFGKMTSLQELDHFNVNNKQGQRILELKNLRQLHKALHLSDLEMIENKEEASEAKLNEKQYLDDLFLEWDYNMRNNNNDVEVIEGLQPHGNIKKLSINCYGGVRSPSWLDQLEWSRIHTLHLYGCRYWEEINFVGQLPCLKLLNIGNMSAVKSISHGLRGEFLELEEIFISNMPEWEDWIVPNGKKSFPHLRRVGVLVCPKLKVIPLFEYEISNQDMLPDDQRFNRLTSLERLDIWDCPNLKSMLQNFLLPPSMKEIHQYDHHQQKADDLFLPPSMRELNSIYYCDHICDSNIRLLDNFKFVSTLNISGCSGIDSLPLDMLCNLTRLH